MTQHQQIYKHLDNQHTVQLDNSNTYNFHTQTLVEEDSRTSHLAQIRFYDMNKIIIIKVKYTHNNLRSTLIYTRSELASLAPSFRGHNFVQNTRAIIYNDCAHLRTRMRIFIVVLKPHPQSILRGVVCETILLRSIS